MKRWLIIKTGEKIAELSGVAGDYEHWIARGLGLDIGAVDIVTVYRGEALPEHAGIKAVVITGSGAMVTDNEGWMVSGATWLREAVARRLPILGICFGHQWLAHALGGDVGYNPRGVEVGTVGINTVVHALDDPLFKAMPPTFSANVSHRQSVLKLPPGARHLASSALEPNQAFAYGDCAWGVQFHPEFNAGVIRAFIGHYRSLLEREGKSADQLLHQADVTPLSYGLLGRFARFAEESG